MVKAELRSRVIAVYVLLMVASEVYVCAEESSKPHIMFVLVDDWGWANVGYHQEIPNDEVVTPKIDNLVKEGIELDQHYTFTVCAPSRSSLLTGQLPIHVCDRVFNEGLYNPDNPVSGFVGIPREMTSVAAKLKQAGYTTHQVGKWHVGMATPDHTPTGRGFDSSLGYFQGSNDYYTEVSGHCSGVPMVDLWDTEKPASNMNGTEYEESLFKQRLLDIVTDHNANDPLFLYYGPHLLHTPLDVPDEYLEKFSFIDTDTRRRYQAMLNYLDDVIGDLIDALKDKEMWDNTLFIVVGDNGGAVYSGGGANNYPLKGGNLSDWQGGVRVNAFVTGGYLPEKMQGQKLTGKVHITDWYATFCALAEVDPTDQRAAEFDLPPIDSLNLWPFLSGNSADSPRVDIPISYGTLISGDYKILTGNVDQAG